MKRLILIALLASILLNAKDFTNSIGIKFKQIPSGSFMMGTKPPRCPKDDPFTSKNEYKNCISSISSDELPYHKVRVKSFYMATTEVTQLQYFKIMRENPAEFKTVKLGYDSSNNPVENVSWNDAKEFIKKLNKKEGINKYRLPTEEEWEYAARAGSSGKWFFGDNESKLKKYAWYSYSSKNKSKTHPVAKKKPNKWGLYDIYGNVQEWTSSCFTEDYNKDCYNNYKSIRGGSWFYDAKYTRSAIRFYYSPNFRDLDNGFRLARTK
jgi:formylglycine-generating enzyme required for sulfatase activity